MTVTSSGNGAYIRGGGVSPLDGRHLRRALIAIGLSVLAGLALVLTVDAAQSALAVRRLQTSGQIVQVTVTGCLGIASGTGITPVGYTCRGSFVLQGHRHNDVIQGTSVFHPVGQSVTGIADPQEPGTLFTRESFASAPSTQRAFVVPACLFALLLAGAWLALRLDPWNEKKKPAVDSGDL